MPRFPKSTLFASTLAFLGAFSSLHAANPIITDVFTADPAALVYKDTVYLYTGHDEAADRATNYRMNEWLCFSSTDMVHWTAHGSPMSLKDFAWARSDAYAMADKVTGPWKYIGPISEIAGNSNTIHPAIIEFKGQSYFIYHNGGIQRTGSSFRRSVCVDYLYYNPDGTIKPVVMTTTGITTPAK